MAFTFPAGWLRFARLAVRVVAYLSIVIVGVLAGLAVWIGSHGDVRHDHFERPIAPIVTATRERDATTASETVRLVAADGSVVNLRVVRDLAHEAPRRVMVLLGGHRTGREAARLVGEPGDMAVVALDYPYEGPDRIRGVTQIVRAVPVVETALLETPRAVLLALDWVVAQPWADVKRIELVGVSLGSPFAAVAGALDARFSRVWIVQGAADNRAWLERTLARRIPQAWLRRPVAGVLHRLAHGASFDTEAWVARIAPRPVVILGAREDPSIPIAETERLFAAAGEPKELVWVDGAHINPRRPETVRRVLDAVRARM